MQIPFLVSLISCLALAACSASGSDASSGSGGGLLERKWVAVEVDTEPALEGALPTLRFESTGDGQRVVGSTGVNHCSGGVEARVTERTETLESGTLTFGELLTTRMARIDPPGCMQQERRFLSCLRRVDNYVVDGRQLELRANERVLLSFQADATAGPSE